MGFVSRYSGGFFGIEAIEASGVRGFRLGGVNFFPMEGVKYRFDYMRLLDLYGGVIRSDIEWVGLLRALCRYDSFFLQYFGFRNYFLNNGFSVLMCWLSDRYGFDEVLHLWFREAGKSTILTRGKVVQVLLGVPEAACCVMCYSKDLASSFVRGIRVVLERSEFLRRLFPDVLWNDMSGIRKASGFKWNDEELTLKRLSSRAEASVSAHGLIKGMPTGRHFDFIAYDDIETMELVNTPVLIEKLKDLFDMSLNITTGHFCHIVTGTPYHEDGVLKYVEKKKDVKGQRIYRTVKVAATRNGEFNGASRYLPQRKLDLVRSNKKIFYSQYLLEPTPSISGVLSWEDVVIVSEDELPNRLDKFIVIDPASGLKPEDVEGYHARGLDAWAVGVIGVEPVSDDMGASNIYILNALIQPTYLDNVVHWLVGQLKIWGFVHGIGVEKAPSNNMFTHIQNALEAQGIPMPVYPLKPAGRNKAQRIVSALSFPLKMRKIHLLNTVHPETVLRLKYEMERFPYWHDDGLDMLAYIYDLITDRKYPVYRMLKASVENRGILQQSDYDDDEFEMLNHWLIQ